MPTVLPVLTFHAIDSAETPVAIAPRLFEAMLARLAADGWRTVTVAEFLDLRAGLKPVPPKAMLITFDDGYGSVATAAAPVLGQFGFSAVLFLTPTLLGRDLIFPGDPICPKQRALTWGEAEDLLDRGFELGSHAQNHDLRRLSDPELFDELRGSHDLLRERLGHDVKLLAYPFGYHDDRVAAEAARVYDAAFTTELDWVRPGGDAWRVPRLDAWYLRFLARRGHLEGPTVRGYVALRRGLRSLRHFFSPVRSES